MTSTALALHLRDYPGAQADAPAIVLLHGLFGSGTNWHGIAKSLAGRWRVLAPDLRNHGASPQAEAAGYEAMVADIAALLDANGIASCALVGHSMGGKLAMQFALSHPERVRGLVVVDMAPVAYPGRLRDIVTALQGLDLSAFTRRADADAALAPRIVEPAVRAFLLQNLVRADGRFAWRFNLSGLTAALEQLMGFEVPPGRCYERPALFLHGTDSDYVGPAVHAPTRALFPAARFEAVAGAGHWVHAEQPAAFLQALARFLD
jgi:pimeloyl-ACP methyl ester carboxylesterase